MIPIVEKLDSMRSVNYVQTVNYFLYVRLKKTRRDQSHSCKAEFGRNTLNFHVFWTYYASKVYIEDALPTSENEFVELIT